MNHTWKREKRKRSEEQVELIIDTTLLDVDDGR